MKIIEYGLSNRNWFNLIIEKHFYSRLAPKLKPKHRSCLDLLGRNFSYFIFEHKNEKNICLFDISDGSGSRENKWWLKDDTLDEIIEKNNINDFVIFKSQLNRTTPKCYRYYKYIDKTIPLGYFPDNLKLTLKFKKKYILKKRSREKDIDILWLGSVHYNMGEGIVWPKDLDFKHWSYGKRIAGFEALKKLSKIRKDLNIICTDQKVPLKEYFNLISRSKICFDFPGVGEFTKRFIECLMFEKCVMSFRKTQELNFELKENFHYLSIEEGDDLVYSYLSEPSKYSNSNVFRNIKITPKDNLINKINNSIDNSLENPDLIEEIENNVSRLQEYFTLDYMISYIKENALKYFFPNN